MLFQLVAQGLVVAEGVRFADGSAATRSLVSPGWGVTFSSSVADAAGHHQPPGPPLILFERLNSQMQRFELVRERDVSGSSGVGVVAQGVLFSDGSAAMHWCPEPCSSAFYRDIAHVLQIHDHGGTTRLRMLDLPPNLPPLPEPPELLT